jgi:ankyrin repeat domain-containing protein 50
MFWLQPGGQTIGDQVFNAFSYWERKSEYITSYQADAAKVGTSRVRTFAFWPALLLTTIGYIYQFVGLRALHASVTLYQLVATLIMAIIRSFLRSKRLGREANNLGTQMTDVEGHELDWNALRIDSAFHDPDSDRTSTGGLVWLFLDFQF